jgi:hypothetical protein
LEAITSNNLWVVAGTVGVLLLVVPVVIGAVLLVTGNGADPGGLMMIVFLLACGAMVMGDLLRKSGPSAGLAAFAAANDLELVRGTTARHYAGSVFAAGQHAVHQSVRTRGDAFLEVGESIPTTIPADRRPNQPVLFLRARLAGPTAADPDNTLVTPELERRLTGIAGPYRVEVAGDELTLLGSRPLDSRPRHVEEAFELAATLAARADAHPADTSAPAETTLSGIPLPNPSPRPASSGRTRRPLIVVGWTLAVLVLGPLAIAVVMSILDDHLRGAVEARLVVSIIVVVTLLLVARLVREAVTPKGSRDGSPRVSARTEDTHGGQ